MRRLKLAAPLLLITLVAFALPTAVLGGEGKTNEPGSITGNVYCDKDKNGVCDCEEGGIKDVQVKIFTEHCGGTALQAIATDEKGNFAFESFEPGTYYVLVDLVYVCGGRVPTTKNCRQVTLAAGETVTLPAFGYSEFGQ
ncbi:MAG: hypothetical protein HKP21_13145 [Xanthomonadales bacterium]|nr:hypothetical protein [Gammaproteobacteria bacterium]MBT8075645.1 hypothetical protein [Gammaproteobacteria bacterium]NNK05495.1 hypothetical protein [Xanthomonadales bacterium]NNK98023.1 hypothetical protein [Xanthomonadales bacterium]